jgi:hypothetical protein
MSRTVEVPLSIGLMLLPMATTRVWFIALRTSLLLFVCQLAKNAGVVKKPTRGMRVTISFFVRSVLRS